MLPFVPQDRNLKAIVYEQLYALALVYSFRQQIGEEVEHSFFPNDPSAG